MIRTINSNLITKKELVAHYGRSLSTIRRWLAGLEIKTSAVYYPKEIILLIDERIRPHIPKRINPSRNYQVTVVKRSRPIGRTDSFSKVDLEHCFRKADTTIYRWIKTAGLPTSKRFYSPNEVEKIKEVGTLFAQRMTAREIKEFLQI